MVGGLETRAVGNAEIEEDTAGIGEFEAEGKAVGNGSSVCFAAAASKSNAVNKLVFGDGRGLASCAIGFGCIEPVHMPKEVEVVVNLEESLNAITDEEGGIELESVVEVAKATGIGGLDEERIEGDVE